MGGANVTVQRRGSAVSVPSPTEGYGGGRSPQLLREAERHRHRHRPGTGPRREGLRGDSNALESRQAALH